MRKIQILVIITALSAAIGALAQVPSMINYQGRLSAGDSHLFDGPGLFKFALVNGGTNLSRQATAVATVSGGRLTMITVTDGGQGYGRTPAVTITDPTGMNAAAIAHLTAGVVTSVTVSKPGRNYSASPKVRISPPPPDYANVTYWSNDGSSTGGGEPGRAVPLLVNQDLFSVNLGDTGLSNMTAEVPPSIFTNSGVWLRIWFSDGAAPFQQFQPDQRVASVGYAMMAANIVDGAITSSKLAPGLLSEVPHGMAVFTNSGTWTRPPGVNSVHVKLWGGGGGGGEGPGGEWSGSCGGGGGYCEGVITVTGDVSVTVGSGGAGGSTGGDGGNSSFLSLTANGGSGGSSSGGGNGGSASGGSLNVAGQTGGQYPAGNAAFGGGLGFSNMDGSGGFPGGGGQGSIIPLPAETSTGWPVAPGAPGVVVVYY
jgi:hypothetical protein